MFPYYPLPHYTEAAPSEYAPPKHQAENHDESLLSTRNIKDDTAEEHMPNKHVASFPHAQVQPDPAFNIPQSLYSHDSEFLWQQFQGDDLVHSQTDDTLADLAPLALGDYQTPFDVENSTSRQKRQREKDDEFTSSKRLSFCPVSIREARERMNNLVANQITAFQCLQEARSQLQSCQEHVNSVEATMHQANQAASEASHDFCDELLQEETHWNDSYKLLLQFRETHGHANVPRNPSKEQKQADSNLSKLAGWVGRQRTNYRRPLGDERRPEPYQIVALQRVGFDFDPHQTSWMKRYAEIKQFKAIHGHFDVSSVVSDSGTSDESCTSASSTGSSEAATLGDNESNRYSSLASWVRRQQYQYKLFRDGNSKSEMSEERIKLLEDIEFPWRKRGESWMERYAAFRAHQQGNGSASKKLYDWIKGQCRQLKRYQEDPTTSTLSEDQVALLSELSLSDLDLRTSSWSTRYDQLLEFKKQHGHCVVPCKYPLNQKLASWVGTQRRQYHLRRKGESSQITEERIKALTKAGFEWEVSAKRRDETRRAFVKTWDEVFAEMQEIRNQTGTLGTDMSRDVHEWLVIQQEQYRCFKEGRPTSLCAVQIEKLQSLGIDDDFRSSTMETSLLASSAPSQTSTWEQSYTDLLIHRLTHNSFQVPTAHKLYHWVQEQRTEYDKYINGVPSVLTSECIRKLNVVGFQWNENGRSSSEDPTKSWDEMFAELLAFRIRFKSFDVSPENNKDLHDWMVAQRSISVNRLEGSSTSIERIRKLREIGFPCGEDCTSVVNEKV